VVLGITLMALAIGAVCMYTSNHILRKDADIILDNLCKKEAAMIDDTLNDVQKSVQIMEQYSMAELAGSALIENSLFRHNYTEQMREMFLNIAANTDGVVSFYLRYSPELAPSDSGFFMSINENGELVDFPLVDILAYEPDDISHVGWYYMPVNAGKAVWMAPYYNRNNNIFMVSYVTPLYKNDTLIGVAGMDIDFSVLTRTVNQISVYERGNAYLMSGDGETVYNDHITLQKTSDAYGSRFAEATTELANGMTLLIRADYNDIQKDSFTIINRIAVITVLVLAAAITVTILLTRRMIAPLTKLTDAARQLADGKTDITVDYDADDELGTLAVVFNHTAKRLGEHMSYINTLAYRDSLTGVRNRTAYIDLTHQLDCRMGLGPIEFAMIVTDINGLKQTNDRYGHDTGNELIQKASGIICRTFTHSPVFRIGGDEFVIILENSDYEKRHELIKEMDKACANQFIKIKGTRSKIPISIARGMAEYDSKQDDCTEDVFNRADSEMYQHKQKIKGQKN